MASTQTITVTSGNLTEPIMAGAGSVVKLTPASGAVGTVQYTYGTAEDIKNGVATWYAWKMGDVTSFTQTLFTESLFIRAWSKKGTVTFEIDSNPAQSLIDSFSPPTIVRGYVLAMSAVPYGIANSGTVTTGGAYTAGTAYSTAYSGGIWLYFPAAAFASSAAGFYWCVASSTTVFNVYTDQSAATLVTGSNVGFTGDTTQRTAVTVTVPANAMGKNGALKINARGATNSTAGNKTYIVNFGGTTIFSNSSTSTTGLGVLQNIQNRGSVSRQYVGALVNAASTTSFSYTSIDTSIDQSITFALQLATATDVCVLENYMVEILPQN